MQSHVIERLVIASILVKTVIGTDKTLPKGHLQPFGNSGRNVDIEVLTEFPEPLDFFNNYVKKLKPVKLAGVARHTRAVQEWTDDYFLSLDVPADSVVHLETRKKENRSQEVEDLHFHEFLKIYNTTEHYMVDNVPRYLKQDVFVPCSLQWLGSQDKGLASVLMWFSSGGTKSVVHTDSSDNINCLIRGEKAFVLVNHTRDADKIELTLEGSYSTIDVDSVDLTLYPKLSDVEFYHVNMTAGDCLYIPYQWIHQVRSFHSNLAVNFWWHHYASLDLLDQGKISSLDHCDPDLTLDRVKIAGLDLPMENFNEVRDFFLGFVRHNSLDMDSLIGFLKQQMGLEESEEIEEEELEIIKGLYSNMDTNKDGLLDIDELSQLADEEWQAMMEQYKRLMPFDEEAAEMREYAEYVAADRKDEL